MKNHILHLDQPLQLVLPLLILGQRQQQLLGKLERKNRCQLKIINPQGKVERKFKEAVAAFQKSLVVFSAESLGRYL